MMGGVRKSVGMIALYALIMGVEAAPFSDLSFYSQEEIKTVEYEPIPQIVEMEEAAGQGEEIVRTHEISFVSIEEEVFFKTAAMAEAGNQGEDGLWLVMSVIYNREKSDRYPNTAEDVVFQSHQFSSVSNGSYYKVKEFSEECERAFARINAGEIAPEIVAFETKDSYELDKYFEPAFEYRDHKFYTEKE
jgi:N-acetylmuramoyl-L-alanine amidase